MRILIAIILLCSIDALSGQGIIDITEKCQFPKAYDVPACMVPPFELYDELVFKKEESFQEFFKELKDQRPRCDGVTLPYIDFSKYMLLSKWSSGGGCSTNYEHQVTLDTIAKEIVYTVHVQYEGTCEMLAINNNFVLVPIVADDYRITCRLIEDYNTGPSSANSPRVDSLKKSSSIIIEEIKTLQDSLRQIAMEISAIADNEFFLKQKELELYGVQTYTIRDTTELYINHDFKSKKLAYIPPNSKVRVFDKYGYYLNVKYNGKTGWIKSGWIVRHEDIIRLKDKRIH